MVQIANVEVLKQLGRGIASRAIANATPIINPLNLLSKDPNAKLIYYPEDYKITQAATLGGKVLSDVSQVFGVNYSYLSSLLNSQIFTNDASEYDRNYKYVKYFGDGQKHALTTNVGRNMFGNYIPTTDTSGFYGNKTLGYYVYSQTYLDNNKNKITTYLGSKDVGGEGVVGSGKNKLTVVDVNQITVNTYDKSLNGTAVEGLSETLISGQLTSNANLNILGLGGGDQTDNFSWGVDTFDANKVNRGLLYYTSQIVKTNTKSGNLINQLNDQYTNDDGSTLYKGVKCRSWTVVKQYSKSPDSLIRSEGNGVDYSVLKDSIIPKMFPQLNDDVDKRRYMFSFENLAFSYENWSVLPPCEQGYTGGRIMWFIPYNVTYSESNAVAWNSERILGRIEPIYNYVNNTRSATLGFTLLMDYPEQLSGVNGKDVISDWFKGCGDLPSISDIVEVDPNPTSIPKIPKPTNNQNINDDVKKATVYFDNNIDKIDTGYEYASIPNDLKNLFGLNEPYFNGKSATIGSFYNGKTSSAVLEVVIVGFCSKKFTNNYNAGLGFRRAYALMNDIMSKSNGGLNILPDDNKFNGDTSFNTYQKNGVKTTVTSSDLSTLVFTFKDTKKNITFIIKSNGEESSAEDGLSDTNIDDRSAKIERRAEYNITKINPDTSNNEDGSITTNNVVLEPIIDRIVSAIGKNPCHPYNAVNQNGENILHGDNYINYYSSAFVSQTPEDLHRRLTFLNQCTRPGQPFKNTDTANASNITNTVFGKAPICVLRLGDFVHSKIVINNISMDYGNPTWDLNPEGMGIQPMIVNVTMDFNIIGGQSLAFAIDRLQSAVDFNFIANATYYGKNYFDGRPYDQQTAQSKFEDQQSKIRAEGLSKLNG